MCNELLNILLKIENRGYGEHTLLPPSYSTIYPFFSSSIHAKKSADSCLSLAS